MHNSTDYRIPLCLKIEAKLLQTKKPSTIMTYTKQLKCLGLSSVDESNLKGHIQQYIDTLESKGYKNSKCYVNALLRTYECVDYDTDEINLLKHQYENHCNTSDAKRQQKKDDFDYFFLSWRDLQHRYEYWRNMCKHYPTRDNYTCWLLCALYSDEHFGAKRSIDIVNLTRNSIKGNCIEFTACKNNFQYKSQPLSNHILEPLNFVLNSHSKQTVLLTPSGCKFSTDYFRKRFRLVMGEDGVNTQYIRQLWASWKYSKRPSAKELMNHCYELNHSADKHLSDYVQEYRTIKVIKTLKFKRPIRWVRC